MKVNDVVVSNLNSAYVRSQDICEIASLPDAVP